MSYQPPAERTVYSFETSEGVPLLWTTDNQHEAKAHGVRSGYRVIAHVYQLVRSEPAWDFTPRKETP